MSSSTVTFVTALLRSKEASEYHRDYFELFRPLAESGINMIVFMSSHLIPTASEKYPAIQFEPVVFEELECYKIAMTDGARLPDDHAEVKDTKNYMAIINAKTELVLRAMGLGRQKTTHYGWIDFGIACITPTPAECFADLKERCERLKTPILAIPGIWGCGQESLTAHVNWRFCGGLFVGDEESVRKFCVASCEMFANIVKDTGVVAWEVNTWARLEREGWKFDWYPSDHNKTMLRIPE